jgi:two-component system sensor histidine kinase TctE
VLMRAGPAAGEAVHVSALDLAALARRVGEEWVPQMLQRGVDFGLAVPDQPLIVQADGPLLAELLSNLLDNALRYGHSGGRITLGVQPGDAPQLYVEDGGPGIEPAERRRVFERFYRSPGTHGEGCGLGLAIVREIAELHGAAVRIDANPSGRGARVTVQFSAAAQAAKPLKAHVP